MAAITAGTLIQASVLRSRLTEVCNAILPTSGYYASDQSLPDQVSASYLCTRAELISSCNSIINGFTPVVGTDLITSSSTYTAIRNLFSEMGRCRKMHYYQAGAGDQTDPSGLTGVTSAGSGTWTYFKSSFSWTGNNGTKPAAASNANTSVTGYKTLPDTSTGWAGNTRLLPGTANSLSGIIYAVQGMEQLLTNFKNEWTNRNGNSSWWNGAAGTSTNTSNRVFFVRYWCHTNCHSDHSSRGRR